MKRQVYTNTIFNEDCLITMNRLPKCVDVVLTSPPYNTSRPGVKDKYNSRYDSFKDFKTYEDYIDWTVNIFENYDHILKKNGCILYNMSYSSQKPDLMWLVIAEIIKRTEFTVADCITWKKSSAIPNNVSSNKLTRICEPVFVICRKSELQTFFCNKKVVSKMKHNNQASYEVLYNFIEARNNDGSNELNKATFSTDLCRRLLRMYAKPGFLVYDSFLGTGTLAKACIEEKMKFIGSETSKEQCMYAQKIIKMAIKSQVF